MKFIDTAKFRLIAGKGGNGAIAFRREKYVPHGGPNGGNGGNGGSIYLIGDRSKHTLLDFSYKTEYKAPIGDNGGGTDRYGRSGEDLILPVPLGTTVIDVETDAIIADITHNDEKVLLAKGGIGGRGNMHFATPEQRTPRIAEDGTDGEVIDIILELKLIADVGIIGLPNVGKSTFISKVSSAKPKIADYPFTTLTPNLGVVKIDHSDSFVLADMPGLIENAHLGVGLGLEFLRHIERTKMLLHFIDVSLDEDIMERYDLIRNELSSYSDEIKNKKEIIALTKSDMINSDRFAVFEKFALENNIEYFKISSVTASGIDEVINKVKSILARVNIDEKNI